MPDSPASIVIGQLVAVLREALEGSPERWSYFTDAGPQGGLFGTLSPLQAGDVSRPVAGTTVAAHVFHTAWAMGATAAWIRGDRSPQNWKESWRITTVDDTAWTELVADLRRQYEDLRQAIQSHALDNEESFGGAVGAITHVAYHLSAVRQKVAMLHSA